MPTKADTGIAASAIDDLPQIWDGFAKLVRAGLDISAFGVQIMDLPPDYTTASHDESDTGQQELYVALRGSGAVVAGDLRVPLDILADRFGAAPDDRRLWRVADAGLEVWSDVVPIAELRQALPAALRLSRLGRYTSWQRIIPDLGTDDLAEHGGNAQAWLDRLPGPAPVGSPPGAVAQSVRAEDS